MYKTLSVVALLVATFAFTSGSKPADASASGLPSPLIVTRGKLVNQTTSIPTTTLFTPAQTGLYRLSVYTTVSTADPSSNFGSWNYVLNWTDDAGGESCNSVQDLTSKFTPPTAFGSEGFTLLSPGSVSVFEAIAGSTVTYSVTKDPNQTDSSVISVYWTVERLE